MTQIVTEQSDCIALPGCTMLASASLGMYEFHISSIAVDEVPGERKRKRCSDAKHFARLSTEYVGQITEGPM